MICPFRRFLFHVLRFSFLLLIVFRVGYDVKTWLFGGTIAFHSEVPGGLDYLLEFPPGYHDYGQPRPLLVYLHGAGNVGGDINALKHCGPCHFAKEFLSSKDFPFIVLMPHAKTHGWKPDEIHDLLERFFNDDRYRWKIDKTRVYLTGHSMGGFGTFRTAAAWPGDFAAILPLAGGGDPEQAMYLQNVPTWCFHGDRDTAIPLESSRRMIDAMKERDFSDVQLTVLNGGHDIAPLVYRQKDVYDWLLSHSTHRP